MEIRSVDITSFSGGGLYLDCEGQQHIKSLPCLSVVQAVEGSYDISLAGSPVVNTGEGGIFIAPAEVMQRIIHHNGAGGMMRARWAFLDVTVNRSCLLEDIFVFPVLMPRSVCDQAGICIDVICSDKPLCEKYAAAYNLVGMLIDAGTAREMPDKTLILIRSYVADNYTAHIGAADIAANIHCSVSQVFRYTRKYFNMSPSNYINSVRLRRAAEILENSSLDICRIADSVGFDDHSYFTKLFRSTYGMPPANYRKLSGEISRSVRVAETHPKQKRP